MNASTDPITVALDALMVPDMAPEVIDRIMATAGRAEAGRATASAPSPRRRHRRWTRRGVWTSILAINLIVASAVAAAIGGGVISGDRIAQVARHVVETLRPVKSAVHPATKRVHSPSLRPVAAVPKAVPRAERVARIVGPFPPRSLARPRITPQRLARPPFAGHHRKIRGRVAASNHADRWRNQPHRRDAIHPSHRPPSFGRAVRHDGGVVMNARGGHEGLRRGYRRDRFAADRPRAFGFRGGRRRWRRF